MFDWNRSGVLLTKLLGAIFLSLIVLVAGPATVKSFIVAEASYAVYSAQQHFSPTLLNAFLVIVGLAALGVGFFYSIGFPSKK